MHTYQLTALALAALSNTVNANPIVTPSGTLTNGLPSVTKSFQASGFPRPTGHGPEVPQSTVLPGASFSISGATTGQSCTVNIAGMPMCASGSVAISNTTSCIDMKGPELHRPKQLKCTASGSELVEAYVSFRNDTKSGNMTLTYNEGLNSDRPVWTGTAHPTGVKYGPLKARATGGAAPNIMSETEHCECSIALASEATCLDVKCYGEARFTNVEHGSGPQPDKA